MRIAFTIVTLIFILIAPYWLYLPLIVVGVILFPLYLESVGLGLAVDVLYGGAGHGDILFGMPFAFLAAVLTLFAVPLREHLRFQS
ncbi:hypothetical protein KW800_02285 [Candidatus Parcubacteria bacterium]|nr:hypothetical protein [Candidatus Parcubacteria bacterium]